MAAWLRCQSRHSHQVDDKYALDLNQEAFNALCTQLETPAEGEVIVVSGVHTSAPRLKPSSGASWSYSY